MLTKETLGHKCKQNRMGVACITHRGHKKYAMNFNQKT